MVWNDLVTIIKAIVDISLIWILFYAVLKKIREEEECKKTKEKEKEKEKDNNCGSSGLYLKENKKENKAKKIVKINRINNGKNIKEKNFNNKINTKKEKQIIKE